MEIACLVLIRASEPLAGCMVIHILSIGFGLSVASAGVWDHVLQSDSVFGSLLGEEVLSSVMLGFGFRKVLQGCGEVVCRYALSYVTMCLTEECVFSCWSGNSYLGVRLHIKIICI